MTLSHRNSNSKLGMSVALILIAMAGGPSEAQNEDGPVLQATPPADVRPLEEVALDAYRLRIRQDPTNAGLAGDVDAVLAALTSSVPAFRNERLAVAKLAQEYRGLPIHGDAANIAVILEPDGTILRTFGKLIDPTVEYTGHATPISPRRARRAIRIRWEESGGREGLRLRDLQLVALPEQERIAWRGRLVSRVFGSSRMTHGVVLVDATSGALIAIDDRPAEVRVLSPEIDDQPRSMDLTFHENEPSKALGNTLDFSEAEGVTCDPPAWTPVRLGDAQRLAVVSFEGTDGSVVTHFTEARCVNGGGEADFAGGSPGSVATLSSKLYAQDLFVKTRLALSFIDPLMGEMFSHGSTHPYSWDHDPAVPDIMHRAPVVLIVDGSPGFQLDSPGIFRHITMSETDFEALDFPLPHPLVVYCKDDDGASVSCNSSEAAEGPFQRMALMGVTAGTPFHTRILFHEIGHYYDMYNSHGTSGDNAEIIAQLFVLYLSKRMYDIDYQITSDPDLTCDLNALASHSAGQVVHPECIANPGQVSQEVDFDGPYTARSFTQAYWSLLNGVSCSLAAGQVQCIELSAVSDDYEDRWMEALLFALQIGNDLTPVEIWDAMALFIAANYPGETVRLQQVRSLHGLL